MSLSEGLKKAFAKLTGAPLVDEKVVKEVTREIQRAMIGSDVNIKLVFELSKRIEDRALHSEKLEGLTLREHVLKVVYDELVKFMGEGHTPRMDKHRIFVVGLYGSGKTTSIAKLAYFYKKRGLSVAVVGADVERPAAKDQLAQLSQKIGVRFFSGENPAGEIVKEALRQLKEEIIIVDSAGRNAFDERLKEELKNVVRELKPDETFLVVSADIGQIAGKQAEQFNTIAPISGVIVTKLEGSGKGGGAVSSIAATGAKISFIGTGEKIEDLELYDGKRFVGKLLGIPDIKSLVEKIKTIEKEEELVDEFSVEAFYKQLKASKKLGPLSGVLSSLGFSDVPKEMLAEGERKMKQYEAMINSMTKEERKDPKLVRRFQSRIERIAKGAGVKPEDVRTFLNEFEKMEKLFKRVKKDKGIKQQLEKFMKKGDFSFF